MIRIYHNNTYTHARAKHTQLSVLYTHILYKSAEDVYTIIFIRNIHKVEIPWQFFITSIQKFTLYTLCTHLRSCHKKKGIKLFRFLNHLIFSPLVSLEKRKREEFIPLYKYVKETPIFRGTINYTNQGKFIIDLSKVTSHNLTISKENYVWFQNFTLKCIGDHKFEDVLQVICSELIPGIVFH